MSQTPEQEQGVDAKCHARAARRTSIWQFVGRSLFVAGILSYLTGGIKASSFSADNPESLTATIDGKPASAIPAYHTNDGVMLSVEVIASDLGMKAATAGSEISIVYDERVLTLTAGSPVLKDWDDKPTATLSVAPAMNSAGRIFIASADIAQLFGATATVTDDSVTLSSADVAQPVESSPLPQATATGSNTFSPPNPTAPASSQPTTEPTPVPASNQASVASNTEAVSTSTPTRVFVDLTWNGEAAGRALLLLRGSTLYLRDSDLSNRNLRVDAARAIVDDDVTFIPLSSLADQISCHYLPADLALTVTTAASVLPHHKLGLRNDEPRFTNDFLRSVLLNYSIDAIPNKSISGAVEQRVSLAPNVVFENELGRNIDGSISRGITALTIDSPTRLKRLVVGDTVLSGDDLTGSASVLGASVSRTFSLDPYAVTFPLPTLDTAVTAPTEALVYVNGALVKTIDLQPGRYNLNDIPVQAGFSHTQIVLRDQFGARVAFDNSGMAPTSLLRAGLTEYQYGLGLDRAPTSSLFAYSQPTASARYRLGISNTLTAGSTIQAEASALNGDLNFDAAPRFGQLHGALGYSSALGVRGSAALLEYGTTNQSTSFGFIVRSQSGTYRTISQSSQVDSSTLDVALSLTQRVGAHSAITISDRYSHYLTEGLVQHWTLTTSRPVGAWLFSLSAFTDASRSFRTRGIEISLGRPIGRHTFEAITQAAGSSAGQTLSVSHSGVSPLDTSYQVSAQGASQIAAAAQVGLPYGTANLSLFSSRQDHVRATNGTIDFVGSMVFADGHHFFTQQAPDGYALVDASGMPNIPIYTNNLYAGKTDRSGKLLVPFLTSNQNNEVDASSQGVPLTEIVESNTRNVGPSYHSGTRVKFEAHHIHAIVGHFAIRYKGAPTIPAFGETTLVSPKGTYTSGIDESGRFYVDGIASGTTYVVSITDADGAQCFTTLSVPKFTTTLYDLGAIECERPS
jgi:outer membrane usher protein